MKSKIKVTDDNIKEIVKAEVKKLGNNADLNHIDVSAVTNMSYLFIDSYFNGDISEWDVSNVKDMNSLFYASEFNGDISKWDVSHVEDMSSMFIFSKFNGDISKWNVKKSNNMATMFYESEFDQDISNWEINDNCRLLEMFGNTSMSGENLVKFILKNYNHPKIDDIIDSMDRWQNYIVGLVPNDRLCEYLRDYDIDYKIIEGSKIERLDCAMDVYPELALADVFTL